MAEPTQQISYSKLKGRVSAFFSQSVAPTVAQYVPTNIMLTGLPYMYPELSGVVKAIQANPDLEKAIGNFLGKAPSAITKIQSIFLGKEGSNMAAGEKTATLASLEQAIKDPKIAGDITTAINNMANHPKQFTVENFQEFIGAAKAFDIEAIEKSTARMQKAYVDMGMTAEDADKTIKHIYDKRVAGLKIDEVLAPIVKGDPDMKGVTDAIKANPALSNAIVAYIKSDPSAVSGIKALFTGKNGIALTGDAKTAALASLEEAIRDPETAADITTAINNMAKDPNITIANLKELIAASEEYDVFDIEASNKRVRSAYKKLGMTVEDADEAIERGFLDTINNSGLVAITSFLEGIGIDVSSLFKKLSGFLEELGIPTGNLNSLANNFNNKTGFTALPEFAKKMAGIPTPFEQKLDGKIGTFTVDEFNAKFTDAMKGKDFKDPAQVRTVLAGMDPDFADKFTKMDPTTSNKFNTVVTTGSTLEQITAAARRFTSDLSGGQTVKHAVGAMTPEALTS